MAHTSQSQRRKLCLVEILRLKIVWLLIGLSSTAVAFVTVSSFFLVAAWAEIETSIWVGPAPEAINIGIIFAAFFVPYIVVPIIFSSAYIEGHNNKDDKIKNKLILRAVTAWIFIEAVSTKLFIDVINSLLYTGYIDIIFYIIVFGGGVFVGFFILVVMRLYLDSWKIVR